MRKFDRHSGVAAPLLIDNIDTDQIIPSREMNRVSRDGLGDGLFAGWRYRYEQGEKVGKREDFVLNRPEYAGASILLSGANFGCGSSREHAVWALGDFGIRAIIAAGFGRIFHQNCARNGLAAIELPRDRVAALAGQIAHSPQERLLRIDLRNNEIVGPEGDVHAFCMAQSDRHMLLHGLDHVDYTLQYGAAIDAFEARDRAARPWAYRS